VNKGCVGLALFLFLLVAGSHWPQAADIDPQAAVNGALAVFMVIVIVRDLADRFPRF
jgi:hypothetical protein